MLNKWNVDFGVAEGYVDITKIGDYIWCTTEISSDLELSVQ